ncbi:MAG: glycosyltransferase [Pseudomonadota bacterium]
MKDLKDLRIGYLPGSPDFSAPCDRRRFVRYAQSRGLQIESADPRVKYDLLVLSQRADLSVWSRYPHRDTRIVFDCVDSYLAADGWKARLRGLAKFITRRSRYLQLSHREAVARMCRRADAVICSTDEQRALISGYNPNVRLILDVHDEDVAVVKQNYDSGKVFHFVWEGLASSGIPLGQMRELLEPIAREREIALHIVTDLVYHRFLDKVDRRYTVDDVRKVFGPLASRVYLYDWNSFALSRIAVAADLALIPIDLTNTFHRGKPENKLLLFWRMGVPTLTSATPSYIRAMRLAGLDMACADSGEWRDRLGRYMADAALRRQAGQAGLETARKHYSGADMLRRWEQLFESLFDARQAA